MSQHSENNNLVFGIHAVQALLERSPERITKLLIQRDKLNSRIRHILRLTNRVKVVTEKVDGKKLDQMALGNHQGVVAIVVARSEYDEHDLVPLLRAITEPLVLVLDGVTDPHNLGACLRSADAAGVHAVIVPKDNSAPLNAIASKVSSGAAETIPFFRVTNLARTLKSLQEAGLWITGTAVEGAGSLFDADLTGSRAIVMGSEGKGLRRLTREHCDELVYIPMSGQVSSLNVSVATGVCLFEAARQRMQQD